MRAPRTSFALGVDAKLTTEDEKFYAAHPPRQMASDEGYTAPISAAERKELIDDEQDSPIGELLDILGEAYSIVAPSANAALVDANLMDAKRLPSTSDHVAAAMYPQLVKLLGGPPTLLYTTSAKTSRDTQLLLSQPPVVVIGGRFVNVRAASRSEIEIAADAVVRFGLARVVELSRPRRIFAAADHDAFRRLIAGLRHAFGPKTDERVERDVAGEGERLRSKLSVALRAKMTERLATSTRLDPDAYIAACYRAGDRAGLIASCDATIALRHATEEGRSAVGKLAASPKYLALRRKLRGRSADAEVSTNPYNRSL